VRKLGFLALLLTSSCVWGQSPRDEYRRVYQIWRQTEPTLESEAATGELAARVQRAAVAARTYVAARVEFLDRISREAEDQLKRIQDLRNATTALAGPAPGVRDLVSGAAENITRVADSFGTGGDAGIRQLRTALQAERAALDAIGEAMNNTRQAAAAVSIAGINVDEARENAQRGYQELVTARTGNADRMRKSGTAWDTYYQVLANPPTRVVSSPAKPVAAAMNRNVPPADAEVVRTPTITPVPLMRYTGGWTFPSNGVFHGTQPESVDLTVREEKGHVTGIFYARFRLAAGDGANPVVQFNFEGDLTANRIQTFRLRTTDGVTGTVELIPGPAFNLLEVNFQTALLPNRIRNGNFILVKK